MEWLTFVGKSYYTVDSFVKEATKLGVSRRVSSRLLGGFTWGDRIWLGQGDMLKKTRKTEAAPTTVFGAFHVERLGGLSLETVESLAERFTLKKVEKGGKLVKRGCGEYLTGPSYILAMAEPISEIARYLHEGEDDSSQILLQGRFYPLDPRCGLSSIHFRWGYRKFDGQQFLRDYQNAITDGVEPLVLDSEYRVEGEMPALEVEQPLYQLQAVKHYHLADLYSTETSRG